jgi:hypothetical protein
LERGAAPAANVDGVIGQLRQELVAPGAAHDPYLLLLLLRPGRRSCRRARTLLPLHAQCHALPLPLFFQVARSQQQPPPPLRQREARRRRAPPADGSLNTSDAQEGERPAKPSKTAKRPGGRCQRAAAGGRNREVCLNARRSQQAQCDGRARSEGEEDAEPGEDDAALFLCSSPLQYLTPARAARSALPGAAERTPAKQSKEKLLPPSDSALGLPRALTFDAFRFCRSLSLVSCLCKRERRRAAGF